MNKDVSSLQVFQSYVVFQDDGSVEVEKILGRECYQAWLKTRVTKPKQPEESFRKAITAHCRGVDGRKPFEESVEKELLKCLRRKAVWECFREGPHKIGRRGFQGLGYWERKELKMPHNKLSSQKRKRAAPTSSSLHKQQKLEASGDKWFSCHRPVLHSEEPEGGFSLFQSLAYLEQNYSETFDNARLLDLQLECELLQDSEWNLFSKPVFWT